MVLLLSGVAYFILTRILVAHHPPDSALAIAVGRDLKGEASLAIYAVAIPVAFYRPALACALYVVVAILWLIPDRRIEKVLVEVK